MASTKAEVTVYIDGNDPAVIARMQELIAENERFRTTLTYIQDFTEGFDDMPTLIKDDTWLTDPVRYKEVALRTVYDAATQALDDTTPPASG